MKGEIITPPTPSWSYPVHLVGHVQHAVDDGLIVFLVIQKLWGADQTFSDDDHLMYHSRVKQINDNSLLFVIKGPAAILCVEDTTTDNIEVFLSLIWVKK